MQRLVTEDIERTGQREERGEATGFQSGGMMGQAQVDGELAAITATYEKNLAEMKQLEADGLMFTMTGTPEEVCGYGPWGLSRKDRALGNRSCVEARLLEEFTRLGQAEGQTVLEVALVRWYGLTPSLQWLEFRKWPRSPGRKKLAETQKEALASPTLFRECHTCWDLCNAGHMHDSHTCQGCAEELGVVH